MALFDPNSITAAANSDGEFKLAARLWNADLRFEVGAEPYLMRIREGRISEFSKSRCGEMGREDLGARERLARASETDSETVLPGFDGGDDTPGVQARR